MFFRGADAHRVTTTWGLPAFQRSETKTHEMDPGSAPSAPDLRLHGADRHYPARRFRIPERLRDFPCLVLESARKQGPIRAATRSGARLLQVFPVVRAHVRPIRGPSVRRRALFLESRQRALDLFRAEIAPPPRAGSARAGARGLAG